MNLGSHMTDEQRARVSMGMMGHTVSPESRAKTSAGRMGYVPTDETRVKLSIAHMGKPNHHKGILQSLEHRAKISVALWKGGRAVSRRKANAKRRILGFNPLNSYFVGCEAHHMNNDDVIHIPKKLHQSIRHNQRTGRGMAGMNALAGQYFTEDWT